MDCLFCKIIDKTIPSNIVFEDDQVLAFHDIIPQAPEHALVIPKKHIATINDIQEEDALLTGHMILTAKNVAKELELSVNGYRLVFNVNQAGGQEVYHIHLHILGGRQMTWPPG